MLDHDRPERRVGRGDRVPPGESDGHSRIEHPRLQDHDLGHTVVVRRPGQLGEELGRGEWLRQHPGLPGDARLGDPKRGVDDRRRRGLLGDEMGMRSVQAMQIEGLLEVEEQPLDGPAQAVEGQGLRWRQPARFQHVGQQVQATPLAAVADQPQGARGLADPTEPASTSTSSKRPRLPC